MFTTQWMKVPRKLEHMSPVSIVSNVPVLDNANRISNMILQGSLVQAANVGYDYRHDEKIQDHMFNREKIRGMDITERMDLVRYTNEKVREFLENKRKETEAKNTQLTERKEVLYNDKRENGEITIDPIPDAKKA